MSDFQLFVETNKLKKSELATFLKVSNAFITQICSGSRKLPVEKYALIKAIDEWDSSMLKDPADHKTVPSVKKEFETSKQNNIRMVPTIPYTVYKETEVDIMELLNNPDEEFHKSPAISQFPFTDCHYFVNSDAMIPHLHPNDVLALKKINDEANVINGEICVINSRYNGLIARFVYDEGDYLLLKASDAQTRFTDMRLHKDDIYGVYRILGLIRTNI